MRSLAVIVVLTCGSLYALNGVIHPPHSNPLVHAIALSWLVALTIATVGSGIFVNLRPEVFSLARWEQEGAIYRRRDIHVFRWILLHSPLGWINPNIHLSAERTDCDRLLREMHTAEGVHWLTCLVSVMLAIWYFGDDHATYGYNMLLVNIPFNVYPIMLQRWNRGRVFRVLRRRQVRTAD
jgi:hypothetical protein